MSLDADPDGSEADGERGDYGSCRRGASRRRRRTLRSRRRGSLQLRLPDETAQRAADGLLVNGSVNNAATSQFSLAQRFGNTASGKSLYNFSWSM